MGSQPLSNQALFVPDTMSSKATPLSIESLLQKQQKEKEAAAKVWSSNDSCMPFLLTSTFQPRFLTKEERAKIAIERRTQEIKQQREREEAARAQRETLERQAQELRAQEQDQQAQRYSNDRRGGGRCMLYF